MKKQIEEHLIIDLKFFKNKMLLLNERMYYIKDFKIESEEVKIKGNLFRKDKTVIKYYLTSLDVVTFFKKYNNVTGTMMEDDAYRFILFYNIPALRENWLLFKKQLKAFGIDIEQLKK
jgi:hypothetical protein